MEDSDQLKAHLFKVLVSKATVLVKTLEMFQSFFGIFEEVLDSFMIGDGVFMQVLETPGQVVNGRVNHLSHGRHTGVVKSGMRSVSSFKAVGTMT